LAGAFQTTRDIFENPIWQNIVEFRLFFLIYGKAAFVDGVKIGDIELKRGQWIRSIRNLQSDLEYKENRSIKKYSLSTIQRTIINLVKKERIKTYECELGTLFEVVNYSKYQGLENYKNNIENAERTEREQQQNTDRTETEQQQNNNNNTLKRQKKTKEIKEDIYCIFDHYCEVFQGYYKTLSLTPARIKHINARLEKYSAEQIKLAISNIRTSKYHLGEDEKNDKFYATLEFICRNDETLEKWINHIPKKSTNTNTNKALELYQKALKEEEDAKE
jgi:esterase/lipase